MSDILEIFRCQRGFKIRRKSTKLPLIRIHRAIVVTNWGGASTGTATLDAPGLQYSLIRSTLWLETELGVVTALHRHWALDAYSGSLQIPLLVPGGEGFSNSGHWSTRVDMLVQCRRASEHSPLKRSSFQVL
jgi:hypothetical protein